MSFDDYYTPTEACVRLGIAKPTLIRWRRQGKVPYQETPLGRLYERRAIEQIARERELKQTILVG